MLTTADDRIGLLIRAVSLANKAHAGQTRKGTGDPYLCHPIDVAYELHLIAAEDPRVTADVLAAALLHDVLEDTTVTAGQIVQATNQTVLAYVRGMTNPSKGVKAGRAERKRMDRDHLRGQPEEVKLIKLVDRIANLGDVAHLDPDFRRLYARESQLLLDEALSGVHPGLEAELQEAIDGILATESA